MFTGRITRENYSGAIPKTTGRKGRMEEKNLSSVGVRGPPRTPCLHQEQKEDELRKGREKVIVREGEVAGWKKAGCHLKKKRQHPHLHTTLQQAQCHCPVRRSHYTQGAHAES